MFNNICRFVQFSADQDCYYSALGCRQKLNTKPSKIKLSSLNATLKLVACEVAASSPKVKAIISGTNAYLIIKGGTAIAIFVRCFAYKKGMKLEPKKKLYI
ncbi:hypothetical protein Sjap_022414 [Stephania japonica]|uniref:Uncharacterized protein n=1 Tax=Stephania japonica TaxID=461633 RepID=A0AAP0EU68_9MAGN